MSFDLPLIIFGASLLTSYASVWIYVRRWRQFNRIYLKILFALLILSAFSDTAGVFLASKKLPTYVLFNVFDALQFALISWLYYEFFVHQDNGSKISMNYLIKAAVSLYVVSLVAISLFSQNPFTQHQNFAWSISAALVVIYSFAYFNRLMIAIPNRKVLGLGITLWINCGIAYYFSFTIILFLIENVLVSKFNSEIYSLIWSYNNINNIIKNVLISIGLVYYSTELEP